MPSLFISSAHRVGLTLDVGFKFPDVCPGNLGVNDISLGGNLGRRGSRKSDIPVDGWFINYLKTWPSARLLMHSQYRRAVVKKHLSEFLCFLICGSLGRIDIIDMIFHVSDH
jgi:hypothetical protein